MSRTLAVGAGVGIVALAALAVLWLATSESGRIPAAGHATASATLSAGMPNGVVLPNPSLTSGVASADVTPENISITICMTGYTSGRRLDDGRTVRPPETYTSRLKVQQIAEYGYMDTNPRDYEEDHLIPLEVGGDGYAASNLWPERYSGTGALTKDRLENRLHELVCSGQLGLRTAQHAIASNWYAAYLQYLAGT